MRICYIGDGDSVHNHFMAEWFCAAGHDVLFLTDTPENAPRCDVVQVAPSRDNARRGSIAFPVNVGVEALPRSGEALWRHWSAIRETRRAIREWKPDIVHAHNITGYGYWGAWSGFRPLALTAWGADLNIIARQNALVKWLVSRTLNQADLITADAEALCQTARELSAPGKDIRLLQWGVDLKQFDFEISGEAKAAYRKGADWVFLSTRRLRPIYNIDAIIQAFANVHRDCPNTRLLVVGEDLLKAGLIELARQLNIHESVDFLGWLAQEDLLNAIASSDAFVSVPSSDSTALSLLEAFAARLPAITADLEANHEWIRDGENGLLVEPGNIDALAGAMRWMIEHPSEMNQWTSANRAMVEQRANRDVEMKKLEAWYGELVGGTNRKRLRQ